MHIIALATLLAGLLAPHLFAKDQPDIELIGDSYMVGIAPHLQRLWPGSTIRLTQIGSGLNSSIWRTYQPSTATRFVFIAMGINDLPAEPNAQWQRNYAGKVANFLRRFPSDTAIHWIIPPCAIRDRTALEYARLRTMQNAIQQGIWESKRWARAVLPPVTTCQYTTADRLHFNPTGYREMAEAVIRGARQTN